MSGPAPEAESTLRDLVASRGFAWLLLDQLPGTMVLVVDHDLRLAAAAGQGLRDAGYDPESLPGKHLSEAAPAEAYELYAPLYERALHGESVSYESELTNGVTTVCTDFSPVRDDDGTIVGALALSRDVTELRRESAQHRDVAAMLTAAFEDAPCATAVLSADGSRFLQVNAEACRLFGRPADELLTTSPRALTHPDDLERTNAAMDGAGLRDGPVRLRKRYLRPDGSGVWCEASMSIVRDETGAARYRVAHWIDVTEQHESDRRRAEALRLFETVFANAPFGMNLADPDLRWVMVNRAMCELTGYDEDELLAGGYARITHPDDIGIEADHLRRLRAGEIDRFQIDKRYLTREQRVLWVSVSIATVRDDQGAVRFFVSQVKDISERVERESSLAHQASHDTLTDLPNRRVFFDELHREIARCRRDGIRSAVLLVDLDGFKAVNDTHGHETGDRVIEGVAAALRARVRESDVLARIGGDEFAVLLHHVRPDDAAAIAQQVAAAVGTAAVEAGGVRIVPSASVGVAFIDETTTSERAVMEDADLAMYDAKAAARGGATTRQTDRPADATTLTVVHGDDSDSYRLLLAEMLRAQPGLEVVAGAGSGEGLVAVAVEHQPDAILLDGHMHGSSPELVARLAEVSPGSRVIVVSGMPADQLPITAVADAYVNKARSFDAIATSIRHCVASAP